MQQTEREKLVLDVKCLLLTTVSNFAHLGLVLTLFACYSKTQNLTMVLKNIIQTVIEFARLCYAST